AAADRVGAELERSPLPVPAVRARAPRRSLGGPAPAVGRTDAGGGARAVVAEHARTPERGGGAEPVGSPVARQSLLARGGHAAGLPLRHRTEAASPPARAPDHAVLLRRAALLGGRGRASGAVGVRRFEPADL